MTVSKIISSPLLRCSLYYEDDTHSTIWYEKLVPKPCKSVLSMSHAFLHKFFYLIPETCTRFLSVCHRHWLGCYLSALLQANTPTGVLMHSTISKTNRCRKEYTASKAVNTVQYTVLYQGQHVTTTTWHFEGVEQIAAAAESSQANQYTSVQDAAGRMSHLLSGMNTPSQHWQITHNKATDQVFTVQPLSATAVSTSFFHCLINSVCDSVISHLCLIPLLQIDCC